MAWNSSIIAAAEDRQGSAKPGSLYRRSSLVMAGLASTAISPLFPPSMRISIRKSYTFIRLLISLLSQVNIRLKSVFNKILLISLPLVFLCCGDDFIFLPMELDNHYFYMLRDGELIEVPITPINDVIQIKFFSGTTDNEIIAFENQHNCKYYSSFGAGYDMRAYKLESEIEDIISYAKNLNNLEIIENALPAYFRPAYDSGETGTVRYIYFEFYVYMISKSWGEDLNELIDIYPVKIMDYDENSVMYKLKLLTNGNYNTVELANHFQKYNFVKLSQPNLGPNPGELPTNLTDGG